MTKAHCLDDERRKPAFASARAKLGVQLFDPSAASSLEFPPNRNALTGGAQRFQHSGICPIHSSKLSPPDPEDLACGITDTLSIGRSKWKYSATTIAALDPKLAWRPVTQARGIDRQSVVLGKRCPERVDPGGAR